MKPGIVADGKSSLYQNKEFQSRLRELHKAIRKRHRAELPFEWFEAHVNRRDHSLVCLALLDQFVNAFLNENVFERVVMQFVLKFSF